MKFQMLTDPYARAIGAMFRKPLGEAALVFEYPHAAPRLFHTAFCHPLRIVALSDAGEIVFDRIVRPWRLVRIPPASVIVEMDPAVEADEDELKDLALANLRPDSWRLGSWHSEATLDRLFFALISEAVADLRRVYEANKREKTLSPGILTARFKPWERGQFLGSAALILERADHIHIPENAFGMSRQILEAEKRAGHIEELLAASIAGAPWAFPNICLKCERPAFWRPIYTKPADMPVENAWRYERPENRAPVCKRCAYRMKWNSAEVQQELGYLVWGVRFEAFVAWQEGWIQHRWAESWNLEHHPLWPETCGGATWAFGSGALADAAPRVPEGVYRREEHRALLEKYFPRRLVTQPYLLEKPERQAVAFPELSAQPASSKPILQPAFP